MAILLTSPDIFFVAFSVCLIFDYGVEAW